MTLEEKRKEMELKRVKMAREELEFRILEKQDEIKRLEDHIQIQINREAELSAELNK